MVTVATYPDSYEEHLTEVYPGLFRHIRLLALDPYDLVLTKLTRNADRDGGDVEFLATDVPLNTLILLLSEPRSLGLCHQLSTQRVFAHQSGSFTLRSNALETFK